MSDFVQENKRSVIALVVAFAILVLFVGFKLLTGGSTQPPVAEPIHVAPSSTPTQSSEDAVVPARQPRGVSDRDPFAALPAELEENRDAGTNSSNGPGRATSKSSSSSAGTDTSGPALGIVKGKTPTGTQTGDSKTKKSKSDDSGSKAPVPIGGGVKKEGESTGITVVAVGESSAVARINNLRTTLYLNVPDASGVTFVASLGGGCGWFTQSGQQDRLTICEGDTRQL